MDKNSLIISDLDGTLLNNNAELSDYTISVVNRLIEQGYHFSIATARSLESVVNIVKPLKFKVPVILHNGNDIYDFSSKTFIVRHFLPKGIAQEILDYYLTKIQNSNILNTLKLTQKKYFVVSVHREENVDNKQNLKEIISILNNLAEKYNVPVIVSTHPRTSNRLKKIDAIKPDKRIQFLKPFGLFDYVNLQMNALCTISDSGTISEESSILSFPAISLRQSMERPEAQDAGTIILTGFNPSVVLNSVDTVIDEFRNGGYKKIANDYCITNTSWRVLKLILGNTKLSNKWWGINK